MKIYCNLLIPSLSNNVVIDNFDLNIFQVSLNFVILAVFTFNWQNSSSGYVFAYLPECLEWKSRTNQFSFSFCFFVQCQ